MILALVLEQKVALALQRRLDRTGEHGEEAGQNDPAANQPFLDPDIGLDRLAERSDGKVELVTGPAMLDVGAARNVLGQAVDIGGDSTPGLVLAQAVRQIDLDRTVHAPCVAGAETLFKPPLATMVAAMPGLALLLLAASAASAGSAQPAPEPWNPAGAYVTAGQDEPGFRQWIAAKPERSVLVASFERYLRQADVGAIVPTWQLLRSASSWQRCEAQPFEVPPPGAWHHMVQTLRYIRAHVIPVIGPVEPVSAYRNPMLNLCAGGSPDSAHRHVYAVDLVPLRPTDREGLIRAICAIHAWQGERYGVGLGFYSFLRFHIDTRSFRKWGPDGTPEASPCTAALAEIELAAAGR